MTPIAPPSYTRRRRFTLSLNPSPPPTSPGAERSNRPPGRKTPPSGLHRSKGQYDKVFFIFNNLRPLWISKLVHYSHTQISEWVSGMLHDICVSI